MTLAGDLFDRPGTTPEAITTIYVIDPGRVRRGEVCRVLLEDGDVHAEPFESVSEFARYPARAGYALICDEDRAAARLIGMTRDSAHWVPVLAYAENPSLDHAVRALQAGAASFFAWPFKADAFRRECRLIEPRLRAQIQGRRRAAAVRRQLSALTAREQDVLASLVRNGSNKAIARELGISPRTVETHRAHMMNRLGVQTTAEAIRLAFEARAFLPEEGLLDPYEAFPGYGPPALSPAANAAYG